MSAPLRQKPSALSRALILGAFTLLYAVAAMLPTFYWQGQEEMWRGYYVLVVGVYGLQLGQYGWLANLVAVMGLYACLHGGMKRARTCTVLALVVALHTLTLFGKVVPLGEQSFNVVQLTALGAGFYVWLLALASPGICTFLPLEQELAAEQADEGEEERNQS